jgi:predicted nucleotidyltransferase
MDPVLDFLIKQARQMPGIRRMILFGSRARGDAHARSDYDIAVDGAFSESEWAAFELNAREWVPTLCGLDLIRLTENTSSSLKAAIGSEGRVIYEQEK